MSQSYHLTMKQRWWQTRSLMGAKTHKDGFRFLLIAAVVTVGLWYVPYAEVIVYPFRIFVTFIHETAHALAALGTGGQVQRIQIYANGNGLTLTKGGWGLPIASAGYLGSVIFGGLLLVVSKQARTARIALIATTVLIGAVTLWLVRPILGFGFLAGAGITVGLAGALYFLSARAIHFTASFLGVECCLNAMFDLKTLFQLSTQTDTRTDAMTLAQITLIPATVWAVLWVAISFLILFVALKRYRYAIP